VAQPSSNRGPAPDRFRFSIAYGAVDCCKARKVALGQRCEAFSANRLTRFFFSSMEFNECLVSTLRALPLRYWQSAF
jgi:hypothetical protein